MSSYNLKIDTYYTKKYLPKSDKCSKNQFRCEF